MKRSKRKLYLARFNSHTEKWENLWFTHIYLVYRDADGNIPKFGVSRKSILRIDRKLRDLQKYDGDKFYWRLELGGFYTWHGGKDGIDYFERDPDMKPFLTK